MFCSDLRKSCLEASLKGPYTLVRKPLELVPKIWNSTEIENFVAMKLVKLKPEGFHMIPILFAAPEASMAEASLFFQILLTMDLKLSYEHFVS